MTAHHVEDFGSAAMFQFGQDELQLGVRDVSANGTGLQEEGLMLRFSV